jgi:hypothetical protein
MNKNKVCPLDGSPYIDLCPLFGTLDPKKIKEFHKPENPGDCRYITDCEDWVAERKASGLPV